MTSLLQAGVCTWCQARPALPRGEFCGKLCRQSAYRLRRRRATEDRDARPVIAVYCDPPYVGLAKKYYGDEPTYAGEVDHPALIADLEQLRTTGLIHGWALSCSVKSLRQLLPLCPEEIRTAAWTKPHGAAPATFGIHNCWEAVLVMPARSQRPGVRDHLTAQAARGGGDLPGRKPIAFCAWLFDLLGLQPGDGFEDLFPGTGLVGRAWKYLNRNGGSSPGPGRAARFLPAEATLRRWRPREGRAA